MGTTTEEMTIDYGSFQVGGSTARKIDNWTRDESDYTNGYFEFEFVTTASDDAGFVAELDAVREAFREPRLDLLVRQNGETYLERNHSDNTALNTFPRITKDGDPADTGRSHHFRVRIEYELPADNVPGVNFRRGSTINVEYTPSRKRTVTVSGIYTANSQDGNTKALAQYLAQIAGYESEALDEVDDSATWEQVGEPQIEFFETNKLVSFTRVYREVIFEQSSSELDDDEIVDPQMLVIRNPMSFWNSTGGGLNQGGGSAQFISDPSPGAGDTPTVVEIGIKPPQTSGSVNAPVFVYVEYSAHIKFPNLNLSGKYNNTIRPWIMSNATSSEGQAGAVLIDEKVTFDDYENRILATLQFVKYAGIISQKITHRDVTAYGKVLLPVTDSEPWAFYEYQGPPVRQRIVTERREEITSQSDVKKYVDSLVWSLENSKAQGFDSDWVTISREPLAAILHRGLSGTLHMAEVTIETILQFRKKKKPSVANAGGITGSRSTASG